MAIQATIEAGHLVVRIPMLPAMKESSTGKTFLVASCSGKTEAEYGGQIIGISANAYIKKQG